VRRQLAAMGCDRYEIGVRDPARGMLTREGSADEIVAGIGWLKAMNAQGNDISVRPAGSSGLVLVDDLSARALKELARDGLTPAAVTETSAENYQAWIRVSDGPLLPEIATEAARAVAARYGGDPNCADWRQYGRLAGFTNQKPEHTRADGQQPAVRLTAAWGGDAPAAARDVLGKAQERFEERLQEPRSVPMPSHPREHTGGDGRSSRGAEDRERAAWLCARYPDADVGKVLATPDVGAARRETRARDDGRGDR